MTSSTLYREGDDLDTLLADLDGEYPGQVRVVSVEQQREGGVFGFFARQRVGVHFALTDGTDIVDGPRVVTSERAVPAVPTVPVVPVSRSGDPLADLIASADAAERGEHPAPALANKEFAAMVMELAASKALERPTMSPAAYPQGSNATGLDAPSFEAPPSYEAPPAFGAPSFEAPSYDVPPAFGAPSFEAPPAFEALPVFEPLMSFEARAAVESPSSLASTPVPTRWPEPTIASDPTARPLEPALVDSGRGLALRRQLAELGIPIGWVPSDAQNARSAVDDVVRQFPPAPAPPTAAGEVLAIVGPGAAARHAAEALRISLGLDPAMVWTAGGRAATGGTQLGELCCIAAFVQCHRISSRRAAIVVIATDVDGPPSAATATPVLETIRPDAVWAVVDATSKSADARRALAFGRPADALVVSFAARTSSPATVWDLGVPVAMLGGVQATRARWATVLLDALSLLET